MKRLNLGCGRCIKPKEKGWVNLDSKKLDGVDVVHNIEKLPLPFKDDEFDDILCQDILEHVEYIPVLKDLHRILKKGGIVRIRVPHFTSRNNFIDPTHKKMFSVKTFDFFVKNSGINREYYFDFSFGRIKHKYITFQKGLLFYNYFIQWLVNSSKVMRNLYESTFLSRIFPAENIIVYLVK